jgi:SAM-dependent methyltransferase
MRPGHFFSNRLRACNRPIPRPFRRVHENAIVPRVPTHKPRSVDWYDTPRWYDVIFDEGTRREADFLEEMLRRFGPQSSRARRTRVLEPACGSGRLVVEMARRGHECEGFDKSRAMLERAREKIAARKIRHARVRAGDMASFRATRRFDLAHCLVSTFKYLLDERSATQHLECVAHSLVPGGLYVLGFHLSDYEQTGRARERWVGKRGSVQVICNTEVGRPVRRTRLEPVRTRLTIRTRAGSKQTETRWSFRTYDARQVKRLFARVPELELVEVFDFTYDSSRPRALDDEQLDCVFVLRKLGTRHSSPRFARARSLATR